jgi:hypothetical protein
LIVSCVQNNEAVKSRILLSLSYNLLKILMVALPVSTFYEAVKKWESMIVSSCFSVVVGKLDAKLL